DTAACPASGEDVIVALVAVPVAAAFAIGPQHREHADVVAATDEVLRDDLILRGVQEDAGTGGAALPWRAGFRVAHVPDDIVVDLVRLEAHLHVNRGAHGQHVRQYVAGDAAVRVAEVEPQCIGVANVPHDVAAEEQVASAMELRAGRFPRALGVLPPDPFDEIVLDERIGRAHAADAFDADVANGVSPHDVRVAGLGMSRGAPMQSADVQSHTVRPLDGVVLDDPMVTAVRRNEPALRRRERVARMSESDSLDADETKALFARRERLLARGGFDEGIADLAVRHANVNDVALMFDPEPSIGRAADLLHDRAAARSRRQSGAPRWLVALRRSE